jgi:hypothetical protein
MPTQAHHNHMSDSNVDDTLNQLRSRLRESLDSVNPTDNVPKPLRVHHYCTADGLYGILHSKSFWATDMFCLNDASEMSYAVELAKHTLPRDCPWDQYLENPQYLVGSLGGLHSHVTCFSAEDDMLSQWRAYGALGKGFALGFNCEALRLFGFDHSRFALFPVLYSKDLQEKAISGFCNICRGMQVDFPIDGAAFWHESFFSLLNLLTQFKHPKFFEEKEWRLWLIALPDMPTKFRVVHGNIIPYVEVPFDKSLVASLRLGPTSNVEFGRAPLKMFLEAEGFPGIEPSASEIPLRGLTP